jgi:hypothetical protein
MPVRVAQLIVSGVRSGNEPFAKGGYRDCDQNSPIVRNDIGGDFVCWDSDTFEPARPIHVLLPRKRIDSADDCVQLTFAREHDAEIYTQK